MADKTSTQIEIRPDGPLLVTNLRTLIGPSGERLETKEVVALCRCGRSEKKPFCDGTHKSVGFSGARISTRDPRREHSYESSGIIVHDNREVCAHAAECVRGLPEVFRPGRRPWIQAEGVAAEELIEVIRRCPTGALSYTLVDSDDSTGASPQVREFGLDPAIEIRANGPYNVRGGIGIDAAEDRQPPTLDHYSLCRCGASRNKPYCDGSHAEAGFEG